MEKVFAVPKVFIFLKFLDNRGFLIIARQRIGIFEWTFFYFEDQVNAQIVHSRILKIPARCDTGI